MEFLRKIEDRGYPDDYLLARLKGRRTVFINDWEKPVSAPDLAEYLRTTHYSDAVGTHPQDGIRRMLLHELRWIYVQMNGKLRNVFMPYFVYSELNTLLVCLRFSCGKASGEDMQGLLEFSLLSREIKDSLLTSPDVPAVLRILGTCQLINNGKPDGLLNIFTNEGLRAVERHITLNIFQCIFRQGMHPVVRRFFARLTDLKNIITFLKHMKWQTASAPAYIEGGGIDKSTLDSMLHPDNEDEALDIIQRRLRVRFPEQDAAGIENALMRSLTGETRKWERESPCIGLILNYIWRCEMESRNLSVISHGKLLDRSVIRRELVR